MAAADRRFPAAVVDEAWREGRLAYQVDAAGTALGRRVSPPRRRARI